MNLHSIDLAILVLYMAAIAGMGLYFSKRNVSTEEYFVGGRSFKGWIIGMSLVGTSISSISFLSFPGDSFKTAYLRLIPNIVLPIAMIVAAYVFLPFYRKNRITSAYEYLEMRFGPGVRIYGAVTFIVGQLMRISSILFLLALLIKGVTNLDAITCIVVGGAFVAFYTIVGGINAVIWTDVVQTIVLALGGLLCLAVVLYHLPGGIQQVIDVGTDANKFSFAELGADGTLQPVSWDFTLQSKTATMMIFLGLSMWLTDYGCNQNTVQRYAASRSMHDARVAMLVAALCSVPIWLFFMFLGTSLYVFYQVFPAQAATDMLTGKLPAEDVLPYFIVNELPIGTSGLIIAAALAAAMSSLDSSINAIATVSVVDIYRRHLVKDRDDRHYLKVAHWVAGVTGLLMILGAIWFSVIEQKTLQDTTTSLTSILAGGLFGLFIFGMLTTRGDGRAAFCGIVCTLLFTVWTLLARGDVLPESLSMPFDSYYTNTIGNIVMFTVGYLLGLVAFPSKKPLTNLTIWTHED